MRHHRLDRGGVAQVGVEMPRVRRAGGLAPTASAAPTCAGVPSPLIATRAPAAAERLRDGQADAGRGAGDQRGATAEEGVGHARVIGG